MNELPIAINGKFSSVTLPPYNKGSIALLECNEGFNTHVTESILIKKNGVLQWNPSSVTCHPFIEHLPQAVNGHFEFLGKRKYYYENDVVTLKCDPGYKPVPFGIISQVKNDNGTLNWDIPSASCNPISCLAPPNINNGMFDSIDYTFGKKIKFECDEGYKPVNLTVSEFYCGTTGEWQPTIPSDLRCDPVQCPDLVAPKNGTLVSINRDFRGEAKFACNQGYEMVQGEAVRTCQGDGTWSGKEVQCKVPCDITSEMGGLIKYQSPTNIILDCQDGTQVWLLCDKGKWSKDPPYCTGALQTLNNNSKRNTTYIPTQFNVLWILAVVFMMVASLPFWLKQKQK